MAGNSVILESDSFKLLIPISVCSDKALSKSALTDNILSD